MTPGPSDGDDASCLPTADAPSLATLFCPECGHRSRYDGDWVVSTATDVTHYSCPDCGTRIQSRPDSRPSTGRGYAVVHHRTCGDVHIRRGVPSSTLESPD